MGHGELAFSVLFLLGGRSRLAGARRATRRFLDASPIFLSSIRDMPCVAAQRRDERGSIFIDEDRSARRKLMCDISGAESLSTGQRGNSTRHVQIVRANKVETILAPS